MLEFLNCAYQNKTLLIELFDTIFSHQEQLAYLFESDTFSKILKLRFEHDLSLENSKEYFLSIIISICNKNVAQNYDISILNNYFQSPLFVLLKKFSELKILDQDTLEAVLNEPAVQNLDKIYTIICSNLRRKFDKEVVMYTNFILRKKQPQDCFETASRDYLKLLEELSSLNLLDLDIINLIGKLNSKFVLYWIRQFQETKLISNAFGRSYLKKIFNSELAPIYNNICKVCFFSFEDNLDEKQLFLTKLFNNVSSSTENLKELYEVLEVLKSVNHLNKNNILTLLALTLISPQLKELIVIFANIPHQLFDDNLFKILCQYQSNSPISTHLREFLGICQKAGLFENPEIGRLNIKIILEKLVLRESKFEIFVKKELFTGHHDQLKFDILFDKFNKCYILKAEKFETYMNNLIESINILERNKLLPFFSLHTEEFLLFSSLSFSKDTLMIAQALEALMKASLLTPSTLSKYLKLLNRVNVNSLINCATAIIELNQHPLYFSNSEKQLKLKDLDLSDMGCPIDRLAIFRELDSLKILTEKHVTAITYENMPALKLLVSRRDFKSKDMKLFLSNLLDGAQKNPYNLVLGLIHLNENKLLTDKFKTKYLTRILEHTSPLDLCESLVMLHQAPISKEKLNLYIEKCFSNGIGLFSFATTPTKLNDASLEQYKRAYIIHFRNIYFVQNNVLTLVKRVESSIFKILNHELICELSKNDFRYSDDILKNFLSLVDISSPFNSCKNYTQCMLELEKHHLLNKLDEQQVQKILDNFDPYKTAQAITYLQTNHVLNEETQFLVDAIIKHKKSLDLAHTVKEVLDKQLFSIEDPLFHTILSHPAPLVFLQAIHLLIDGGVFSKEIFQKNIDVFCEHDMPINFAESVVELEKKKVLTTFLTNKKYIAAANEKNFNFCLFTKVLVRIQEQGGLDFSKIKNLKSLFKEILRHKALVNILETVMNLEYDIFIMSKDFLEHLTKNEMLGRTNNVLLEMLEDFKSEYLKPFSQGMIEHILFSKSRIIKESLKFIIEKQLITKENFEFIKNTPAILECDLMNLSALENEQFKIADSLHKMNKEPFFNYSEFTKKFEPCGIRTHSFSFEKKKIIFKYLSSIKFNTPALDNFFNLILILERNKLLNEDNIEKCLNLSTNIISILGCLGRCNLLNQTNLNYMIRHLRLFDNPQIANTFGQIGILGLSKEQFETIKLICQRNLENHVHPMNDLLQFLVHTVIGIQRTPRAINLNPNELNTRQSTHTASVHQSVSESAIRLRSRYQAKITEELILNNLHEIQEFLSTLESTPLHEAAKRYWKLINSEPSFLNHTDPKSKVSVKQLLHLFWMGIQDFSVRIFDKTESKDKIISEGKRLLVQAFYEAQRDGNINSEGVDDEAPIDKKPSCPSGFINKIIEKLIGVHPDVQIIVINTEIVSEKFKAIVCEQAINHIRLQIQAKKQKNEILEEEIINDAVSQVWSEIKESVASIFFEEFKDFFKLNNKNPNFLAYMELGESVELSPRQLQILHKLNQEPSKKRFNEETDEARTSTFSLFSRALEAKEAEEMDIEEEEEKPIFFCKGN